MGVQLERFAWSVYHMEKATKKGKLSFWYEREKSIALLDLAIAELWDEGAPMEGTLALLENLRDLFLALGGPAA